MNYFFWLILSVCFFAVGEFLSKKFALHPAAHLLVWLVIADVLSVLLWLPAIVQKNNLAVVGTLWAVMSFAATVFIGAVVFKEKLNPVAIAGIVMAGISIILLTLS